MKNLIFAFLFFACFGCSHTNSAQHALTLTEYYQKLYADIHQDDANHIFYYKGIQLDDRKHYYGTASWMCH